MFRQALTDILHRLEEAKKNCLVQQYALIGGFAVSAWGVPRATSDFDFALALGSSEPNTFAKHLRAEFQPPDPEDPLRGVFFWNLVVEDHTIPVQMILLPLKWETLIFQKVDSLTIFDVTVPVVNWQPLVLLKLYAGGPQDLLDAQKILSVRRPNSIELKKLGKDAQQMNLLSAFQSLTSRLDL